MADPAPDLELFELNMDPIALEEQALPYVKQSVDTDADTDTDADADTGEDKAGGGCTNSLQVYKRRLLYLVLVIVVVVGVAVAGIVLSSKKKSGDSTDSAATSGTNVGGDAPTFPSFPVPSPAPAKGHINIFATPLPTGMPSTSSNPGIDAPASSPPISAAATVVPSAVTSAPIVMETVVPTGSLAPSLLELFSSLSGADVFANENTPQYKAYQWIATTDTSDKNVTDDKLTQRYAATVVHYALGYSTPLLAVDECLWPTLACNETTGNVSEINLARSSLIGSLPTELGLLTGLRKIDLAQNQVVGSIPDSFYVLSDMQFLYLESNQMTGTLSELIDNTRALEKIFLGDNNFSGPLPLTLRSRDEIRPLRYLNLYKNQFTGTIPPSLRLRNLYYLDLSHNKMSGPLPDDFGATSVQLEHLYLNHNQFTGSIPDSYATIGNSRLITLALNDNQFTGSPPSNYDSKINFDLLTYRVQNNGFTTDIGKELCTMFLFGDGELVELGADCNICKCKTGACDDCY